MFHLRRPRLMAYLRRAALVDGVGDELVDEVVETAAGYIDGRIERVGQRFPGIADVVEKIVDGVAEVVEQVIERQGTGFGGHGARPA